MKPTVLIFVGLPGCGKTTASSYLEKKNIPAVRMGDVTDKSLKEAGLSATSENEKRIREELRSKYGEDIYAKKTADKVKLLLNNHPLVVIDGARSIAEFEYFKKYFPSMKLVFCEVAQDMRYRRLSQRKVRPLTPAAAKERDISELSRLGLYALRKSADFIINNNGTKEQLFSDLDELLKKLNTE